MANFLKAEEMSAKESTTESQILNQIQDFQSGKTQLSKKYFQNICFKRNIIKNVFL